MEKEYKKIISFLKNYQTHTNARGYVLGISGGKDSTIVAKLLVDAMSKTLKGFATEEISTKVSEETIPTKSNLFTLGKR